MSRGKKEECGVNSRPLGDGGEAQEAGMCREKKPYGD